MRNFLKLFAMRAFRFAVTLVTFLIACVNSFSQSIVVNPAFGKVSAEELKLVSYQQDTSAAAIYLLSRDAVDISIDGDNGFLKTTTVRRRIKVLKERGKKYADISFVLDNDEETLREFSVTTYNIKGGKTVTTKMNRKDLFKEKLSNSRVRYKFSAPDVMVGSVIEVLYSYRSGDYYNIDDIYVQKAIPVVKSEAVFSYPGEYLKYTSFKRGSHALKYRFNKTQRSLQNFNFTMLEDAYYYDDMPASKDEEMNFCPEYYRDAVAYECTGLEIGSEKRSYNKTWSGVDALVAESLMFQSIFKGKVYLKEDIDRISGEYAENGMEKLTAIRNLVCSKVKSSGDGSFNINLQDALKKESGTDTELNCLLGSSLVYAGYEVSPVLLRERKYGPIMDLHISTSSFSKLLLKVVIDGKGYYLDASDKNGYLNCLQTQSLVEKGRVINSEGYGSWENLKNLVNSSQSLTVKACVQGDGTLEYDCHMAMTGHYSRGFKNLYSLFNDKEKWLESIESVMLGEISDCDVSQADEWSATCSADVHGELDLGQSQDILYVNPFVMTFQDETLFQDEKRDTPIEFDYPELVNYSYSLTVPEGYEVAQLPQNSYMMLPSARASMKVLYKLTDPSEVNVTLQYIFSSDVVDAAEYDKLQSFWKSILNVYNNRIVLKRQ